MEVVASLESSIWAYTIPHRNVLSYERISWHYKLGASSHGSRIHTVGNRELDFGCSKHSGILPEDTFRSGSLCYAIIALSEVCAVYRQFRSVAGL